MIIKNLALAFSLTAAFSACRTGSPRSPESSAARPPIKSDCGAASGKTYGGSYLRAEDGVAVWHKVVGNEHGPVVFYLHGGPGYNSYTFEKAVGALLESDVRMVYLDQRGCGRSQFQGPKQQFGMKPTVEDIDSLRKQLGVDRIGLIAHSFGGVVALEYLKTHRDRVDRIIMVDTTADIAAALTHQVTFLASVGSSAFPAQAAKLRAVADGNQAPSKKMEAVYSILSRLPLQRKVHYATDDG